MSFQNTYQEAARAQAYNELGFGGTYRLVADSLPSLLSRYVSGTDSLDFGCGTGRSTRYLQQLGFQTIGVDVSREMVERARENDPAGDYRVIRDGDFSSLEVGRFDLLLCAFPFDNIAGRQKKVRLFSGLANLLSTDGRILNIVSTPEIYLNEWVTFTTREFPENHEAGCGDVVRIITREYSDPRPVEDIMWPDEEYQKVYEESGLMELHSEAPLARGDEGIEWLSESVIPPWRIYVLQKAVSDGEI